MGPLGVVVRPPAIENLLGLGDRGKPMLREALAPQRAVEGLDEAVVPRRPRPTEVELDVIPVRPGIEGPRGELCPVVHGDPTGGARWVPTSWSTRTTSSPRKRAWATSARLSRVWLSISVSTRTRRPSATVSRMKSIAQTSFGCVAMRRGPRGTALRRRRGRLRRNCSSSAQYNQ